MSSQESQLQPTLKKHQIRVEDRLAKKAEEYEKRRKLRLEMMERKTNEMSRKVATNRRSEFLAGDREHSSTLHRPIGNVRSSDSHRIFWFSSYRFNTHTHTGTSLNDIGYVQGVYVVVRALSLKCLSLTLRHKYL